METGNRRRFQRETSDHNRLARLQRRDGRKESMLQWKVAWIITDDRLVEDPGRGRGGLAPAKGAEVEDHVAEDVQHHREGREQQRQQGDEARRRHRVDVRHVRRLVARRIRLGGTRQLALIWETFNLMNRANYTTVVDTQDELIGSALVPNPLFGRGTAQYNGRMMQLAARFIF